MIIMVATDHIANLIICQILTNLLGAHIALGVSEVEISIFLPSLNGLLGWGIAMVGFQLKNFLLIICGAFVGSAGTILA